jgi:hypothetical protein
LIFLSVDSEVTFSSKLEISGFEAQLEKQIATTIKNDKKNIFFIYFKYNTLKLHLQ